MTNSMIVNGIVVNKKDLHVLNNALINIDLKLEEREIEQARFMIKSIQRSIQNNLMEDMEEITI